MGSLIHFTGNNAMAAIFSILNILCGQSTEARGKARISYRLAKTVCEKAANFDTSNEMERLLLSPSVSDDPCKIIAWRECEMVIGGACTKFLLQGCSPPFSFKLTQRKLQKKKTKNRKETKIVNGTDAKPNEFPYQVMLTYNDRHFCGGSILNEEYILTAAHCLYDDFTDTIGLKVVAGDHNRIVQEGTEQSRTVKKIIFHEMYDNDTLANDIALLLLQYPLALTRNVQPPILADKNYDATGQLGVVSGWGRFQVNNRSKPEVLQKVTLPIISNEDCSEALKGSGSDEYLPDEIPDTAFCALYPGGGKDSCVGDSGGPMAVKLKNGSYLQVGIVSFGGQVCGDPHFPGVYTKVSKYLNWIQSNAV